jgi:hypothetical protein
MFTLFPLTAAAQPYSVREVGFVEVEAKPYRLFVLSKDSQGLAAEKQRRWLNNELADSNIVLVTQIADSKTLTPLKKPVGDLSQPKFWLVAPDNRAMPFDAATMTGDLLHSPMRKLILRELTGALCAVVLLESNDAAANALAHARAEATLEQVNRVRKHLDHAPDSDVNLLVLPVAERERERWTLWGLGEDIEATDTPKIAIIFGRMRRAGPLFEGTEWNSDDLFARIVALGQACEDELDRKQYFDMPLPFKWSPDWLGQLDLKFDPLDEAVKERLAATLQRPVLAERTPRKTTPRHFDFAPDAPPVGLEPERPKVAAALATTEVGLVFLVLGIVGWIALGLTVWYVENRSPSTAMDS